MKISHAKYTEYDTGGVKEFNSPACLTGMSTSDSITTCKREGAKPIILWIWKVTLKNIRTHRENQIIVKQYGEIN